MDRAADLRADMKALSLHLGAALSALEDPEARVGGSDVASIARERRQLGELLASLAPTFDQAGELRRDYDRLGEALGLVGGAGAAAVVRERRLASALIEGLEQPAEVSRVDQLAARRQAKSSDSGAASRRRKPG